jgi:hypothetical protein
MALYKYGQFVQQSDDEAFDAEDSPGAKPPHSGIYRCSGCGREIVAEEGRQFPPQNHHQHSVAQGTIRWRLAVYADHKPK